MSALTRRRFLAVTAFAAGLGETTIKTALCPGGKERMRRMMAVIRSGRVDLKPLVTHRYKLDDIEAAYDLFSHQRDGVLKIGPGTMMPRIISTMNQITNTVYSHLCQSGR